jgi:D-alanyl-D-alanine carboxypeptidase
MRMMRWGERLLLGLVALALIAGLAPAPAEARQEAFILLDHETGGVLDARNADEPAFPASLTKMMTLYLTFRALEAGQITLDSRLKVSKRASAMPPTKLGLKPGSSIKVEDAILGLVTKSANDAASVLAEGLGGSEERFALLMTRTARELGMSRTVFRNASGLPDGQQRSTARDLARLATRLITDHPQRYDYFSRRSFTYAGRTHGNHNRLLASYRGMDGLKTGYTRASGFNLAASAVRGGRRLVAVVLGGSTARARDAQMADLLDVGFDRLSRQRPSAPVEVASVEATHVLPSPARPTLIPAAATAAFAATDEAAVAVDEPGEATEEERTVAATLAEVKDATPAVVPAPRPKKVQLAKADPGPSGKAVKRAKGTATAAKKRGAAPYGVQVGAFQKSAQARAAAKLAMKRVPDLLRGTFVGINSQKVRKKTVFRAILVGLSKDEAATVCRRLKKHKQDCMILRTGPVTVAAR